MTWDARRTGIMTYENILGWLIVVVGLSIAIYLSWFKGHGGLHDAVRLGNADAVRRLVSRGADINAKDETGGTALQRASVVGNVEAVKFLLARGAAVHSADSQGNTALKLASEQNHTEVVEVLRAACATQ
jgi:ankyrin repeat protein